MIADKLRKAILQAGIKGKLTKQLPEDGNARELLAFIQAEKDKLIAEGKIKKEKQLPKITEDEIPFDIPDTWYWVRLGDIISVSSGKGLTQNNMNTQGEYPVYGGNGINGKHSEWFVIQDTIVIGRVGFYCGCVHKVISNCWVTDNALIVQVKKDIYDIDYLQLILRELDLKSTSVSTAQPVISGMRIYPQILPVPPLAEQQRIVVAIEEALIKIKELEKDELKLTLLQKSFPKKMKDSLLQSAIQGKLTDQLESDGDARALVADIQTEKKRLIKEGKIKKEKDLPEINEDEVPFDIPDNWCWVRLGNIGIWGAGATPNRSKKEYYDKGKIPWIKTGDLNDGIIYEIPECITELALKESSVKLQPKGTVLIAMYGATIGKIGILDFDATTNQACCGCIPLNGVYNLYLFYYLMSHKRDFINQGAGGAQPNISREKIIMTIIPIPPLAEQQRIVERLEQLLPLCDTLE